MPDEDTAELGEGSLAGCEFRRMVSEVLLSQLTLGEVQQDLGGTITQRRSVLNWCQMIAVKPGRWQQLRSFHVWFRCTSPTPGELRLDVAIQQSAFAALGADRELRWMTADTFARRARRYRVGETFAHRRRADRRV